MVTSVIQDHSQASQKPRFPDSWCLVTVHPLQPHLHGLSPLLTPQPCTPTPVLSLGKRQWGKRDGVSNAWDLPAKMEV